MKSSCDCWAEDAAIRRMWRIPLSEPDIGPDEEAAALRVLRSKWLSMGPEVAAFEAEFAAFVDSKHAVAMSNATAALQLALLAVGTRPGDEVIQPALNFVATANVTRLIGAIPVLADIASLEHPMIGAQQFELLLTHKTRAVVVMAYGGMAPHMGELRALCNERGVALVEDSCHSLGASCDGRPIGGWGDVATFSFFPNKNMTTGEGGMATTQRDDIAHRLRLLRSHGMTSLTWERHGQVAKGYDVLEPGFNQRMDELRAAIGRAQLLKLRTNNEHRASLAARYDRWLNRVENLVLPGARQRTLSANHIYSVVLPANREWRPVAAALAQSGIQTSHHYPAIHRLSAHREAIRPHPLSNAEIYDERQLTLPLWQGMTEAQVDEVGEALCNHLASR